MSSNQHIEDSLIRHQIRSLRFANGISNDLKKDLQKFSKKLYREIRSSKTDTLTPGQLARLRELIKKDIKDLAALEKIFDFAEQFVKQEVKYFGDLLEDSTTAESINYVAPESLFATLSDKPITMVPPYTNKPAKRMTVAQMAGQFESNMERSIVRRLQLGVAEGESIQKIAKDVRDMSDKRSTRQAQALVRTAINHYGSEARRTVAIANQDLFENEEYIATLDSRTTIVCAGYDGKQFPLDSGPIPPLHFQCRSLRAPRVKDKYKIPGLAGKRPAVSVDKSGDKAISQVSAETTYSGWLRRQPTSFQDEVLGPRRAELYRKGEVKLENFTDSQGATIPLKDLVAANESERL